MKPNYRMKHEEMLTIASIVSARAEQDAQLFQTLFADWTPQEFQILTSRIEAALLQLTPKPLVTQKALTAEVEASLQQTVLDLEILQIFIEHKFTGTEKAKGEEIIQLLQFSKARTAKQGDQESLTAILSSFTANHNTIVPLLQNKNIGQDLLTRLENAASSFHNLNVSQELAKGDKKEAYRKVQTERNEIYTYISNICRVGKKLATTNLIAKERYTISHILTNIRYNPKRTQHPPATTDHTQ